MTGLLHALMSGRAATAAGRRRGIVPVMHNSREPSNAGDRIDTALAGVPGRVMLAVFDQSTWWVDRRGVPHRIDDMSDEYLDNLVDHLTHHCERYFVAHVLVAIDELIDSVARLEMHPDLIAAEAGAPTWSDLTPEVWLESTALMRSLRARRHRRPSRPIPPDLPP